MSLGSGIAIAGIWLTIAIVAFAAPGAVPEVAVCAVVGTLFVVMAS